jgi:hypothetical protein
MDYIFLTVTTVAMLVVFGIDVAHKRHGMTGRK